MRSRSAANSLRPAVENLEPRELLSAVTTFTLINSQTDQPIKTINSGDTINLADYPTGKLNVLANTDNSGIKSVRFGLDAKASAAVENFAPYALFGDNPGNDYKDGTFAVGSHTLKATPFSGANAGGCGRDGKDGHVQRGQPAGNAPGGRPADRELRSDQLADGPADQVISSGDTINLADYPAGKLNVRADVSGVVKSVRFGLDASTSFRVESSSALCIVRRPRRERFRRRDVQRRRAHAQGYGVRGHRRTGTAGQTSTVTFSVINQAADTTPRVTQFVLINADSDTPIRAISAGDNIDLATLPTRHLSIETLVSGSVKSASISLNAALRIENDAPYALFGNTGNDFAPGPIALGLNTLSAQAFTGVNRTGTAGPANTIQFDVTDSAAIDSSLVVNSLVARFEDPDSNSQSIPLTDGATLDLGNDKIDDRERISIETSVGDNVRSVLWKIEVGPTALSLARSVAPPTCSIIFPSPHRQLMPVQRPCRSFRRTAHD